VGERESGRRISPSPPLPLSHSGPSSLKVARRWAVGWGVLLLTLTSWPSPPRVALVSGIPHFDKLVHFALYAVEAFLLYGAIAWPGRAVFSLVRVLAVTGMMTVWGAVDELHQHWIPGRSMDGDDVAADVTGAAVGALVASALSGRERATS
jgi:VanZ family protein